jgi:predicted phosphodiesterase
VDEPALAAALPRVAEVKAGNCTIGVIHDAGPSRGRLERMRRRFPTADAVVFGHSHIPLQQASGDGFQIFNPGSPTRRRREPQHTMGIARVDDGTISFEHVILD